LAYSIILSLNDFYYPKLERHGDDAGNNRDIIKFWPGNQQFDWAAGRPANARDFGPQSPDKTQSRH